MVIPTLSTTARTVLDEAAGRDDKLADPPERLPVAAQRSVVQSLLKAGLLEEIAAADEQRVWRTSEGGERFVLRATAAGVAAVQGEQAPCGPSVEPTPASDSNPVPDAATVRPQQSPASARPSFREAAQAVLAAWDTTANGPSWLAPHFDALRAAMTKPLRSDGPRPGTKRSAVIALLRRPDGATVAQVVEATGWAKHTVHGFFAGLKKQGILIEVLERVRQNGPGNQGAKGSYSVYRASEPG